MFENGLFLLATETNKVPSLCLVAYLFFRYEKDSQLGNLSFSAERDRTKGYVNVGRHQLAIFNSANLHHWPDSLEKVGPTFADLTPLDRDKYIRL